MVSARPRPSGPGKGKLNPEGPWVLQLGTPGYEHQDRPGDKDRLGDQTSHLWDLRLFVCKYGEIPAWSTESLAPRGGWADWDLSGKGASWAAGVCGQGREGGTGVPAKRLPCPSTPGTGGLLRSEGISHLVKVKEGD